MEDSTRISTVEALFREQVSVAGQLEFTVVIADDTPVIVFERITERQRDIVTKECKNSLNLSHVLFSYKKIVKSKKKKHGRKNPNVSK